MLVLYTFLYNIKQVGVYSVPWLALQYHKGRAKFFTPQLFYMESLLYIYRMFKCLTKLIYKDLHPLNEAVVRITKNKWFDFALGIQTYPSGKFKVLRIRKVNGENVIDVEVKIISKGKGSHLIDESVQFFIPKSELIERLYLIGIRNYKLGTVKIK